MAVNIVYSIDMFFYEWFGGFVNFLCCQSFRGRFIMHVERESYMESWPEIPEGYSKAQRLIVRIKKDKPFIIGQEVDFLS